MQLFGAIKRKKETKFFSEWMKSVVLIPEHIQSAENAWIDAKLLVPKLMELERTPQSAPHHADGPTVDVHVKRILAAVFAFASGASLTDIEEFKREKTLFSDIKHLDLVLKEQVATMQAFALLHDIAKPDTVHFFASKDSDGAAKTLFQHEKRLQSHATTEEKQLYLKLFRGIEARYPLYPREQVMAAFYDKYEVQVKYPRHAELGVSDRFLQAREAIAEHLHLSVRSREILHFLILHHIHVIEFVMDGANPGNIDILTRKAHKAGFDAGSILDLQVCVLFLDAIVGGITYRNGEFLHQTDLLVHFLQSEEQADAEHRIKRREIIREKEEEDFKRILKQTGLTSEEIFSRMDIPFGPKRGEIVEKIHDLIRFPSKQIDFGAHTSDMEKRIHSARQYFDAISST